MMSKPIIHELESIRGIAALLIALFHLHKYNPILDVNFINNSYLMVELFFVISGFVIHNSYIDRIRNLRDVLVFQFLRCARLYPVHLLFLVVFLVFEFSKYIAIYMLDIDLKSIPFEKNNFKAFVENIFLVNAVLPGRAHTYNYPAWSISTEFYTYFLFALITLVSTKRHLFFAVFALTSLILLYTGNTFGFEQVIRCFAGFFVGCLVADFTKSKGKGLDNIIPIGFMVGITLFLCLKTSKSFDILMFPLAAGLIMSLCLSRGGILSTLLKLSPLIWLGTISYSVYMAHASVEFIIHKVIIYVLGAPLLPHTSGALVPALTSSETVLVCLVYLICTIVVSVLVFRYVESPAREGSRRLIALR